MMSTSEYDIQVSQSLQHKTRPFDFAFTLNSTPIYREIELAVEYKSQCSNAESDIWTIHNQNNMVDCQHGFHHFQSDILSESFRYIFYKKICKSSGNTDCGVLYWAGRSAKDLASVRLQRASSARPSRKINQTLLREYLYFDSIQQLFWFSEINEINQVKIKVSTSYKRKTKKKTSKIRNVFLSGTGGTFV